MSLNTVIERKSVCDFCCHVIKALAGVTALAAYLVGVGSVVSLIYIALGG